MSDIFDPFSVSTPEPEPAGRLARALARLASLGDDAALGVPEAVACGRAAIPALRRLLFSREPSGLYEPRRRAVAALAGLKAYDVLAEYLTTARTVIDPVEETGEEAVFNAAARALADWPDPRAPSLLLAFTRFPPRAGVIDALAKLRLAEAIPYFIKGLAEDFTRPSAEEALRGCGAKAAPALLEAARSRVPASGQESASSLRCRRSALALLAETAPGPGTQGAAIEAFIGEQDPTLAVLGCRMVLAGGGAAAVPAIRRLISLLPAVDFLLRAEIEDCLVAHFSAAQTPIAEALREAGAAPEADRLARALRRIIARATGS